MRLPLFLIRHLPKDYYGNPVVCSERDISDITEKGVLFKDGRLVDYKTCARVFHKDYGKSSYKFVSERNVLELNFLLYSWPRPTLIQLDVSNSADDTEHRAACRRFHDIQKRIESSGYTTYDMT